MTDIPYKAKDSYIYWGTDTKQKMKERRSKGKKEADNPL